MAASIIVDSTGGAPSLNTAKLGYNVVIGACSSIEPNSSPLEMFGTELTNIPRIEPGHTVFSCTGWNIIYFSLPSPVTVNSYTIWFQEDYQSGSRATCEFQLSTSLLPAYSNLNLVDDVKITTPYFSKYGSDSIYVTNAGIGGISAKFFQLAILGIDYGFSTFGPRICGFQIT